MSFNGHIYTLVRHIPYGRVLTYGRVAQLLGVPRGARAVGWAMAGVGKTAQTADVPWHRVVNSAGRISLRSLLHTAYDQRDRLTAEGALFAPDDDLKLSNFAAILWTPSLVEVQAILAPPAEEADVERHA
jgi:methylated-DNA-protein-cysteine methyltransferase related protein